MEAMTLEQVRDRIDKLAGQNKVYASVHVAELTEWMIALDAHLSQPAQAVDVAMIDRGAEAAWNMVPRGVAWGDASDHIQQEWKNIASVILTRALSAQKAGPVGGGWQPIETAPKDGTPIFIPYCGRPVPAVWNEHDAEWRWVFLSHGRDNAHREAAVKLWHPMTLPASPTPDKEG